MDPREPLHASLSLPTPPRPVTTHRLPLKPAASIAKGRSVDSG